MLRSHEILVLLYIMICYYELFKHTVKLKNPIFGADSFFMNTFLPEILSGYCLVQGEGDVTKILAVPTRSSGARTKADVTRRGYD